MEAIDLRSPADARETVFERMTKEEMKTALAEHLARYRTWSYERLAGFVNKEYLDTVEAKAPDGRPYVMDFRVFWDGKPNGDLRVSASLWFVPYRPLFGFLPIFCAETTDSFIMSPNGTFVGE